MSVNKPVKPSVERALPFLPKHKYLMTDSIFLIGNGTSRKDFDLERLRSIGTIIGCNALYREFSPDILLAIDAKMLKELNASKYWENNICLIPATRSVRIPNSLVWRTNKFNTSGCFGMKLVNELMKPKKCYMLGMDCYIGNLFDGTDNYATKTLDNFKGVLQHYIGALQQPGNTVFVNVNEKDAWTEQAHATGKYEFMTYEEFENEIMV